MTRIVTSFLVGMLVACSASTPNDRQSRADAKSSAPAIPPVAAEPVAPATPPAGVQSTEPPAVTPPASAAVELPALDARPGVVTVYKTPTCGCCGLWVEHLQKNGFEVTAHDLRSTAPARHKYGIPDELASCHTAIVDGYVVEGHIPADIVKKLLKERPPIVGIVVPGMPIGSPGMEGPNPKPYDVLALAKDGTHKVYATITPSA